MKNDKQLKDKAIDIKGKDYVMVSSRIIYFNEIYTNGTIVTHLISKPDADMVVVKAKVTPDIEKSERYFTGYSQAVWGDGMVNKTAALENAETSAVGRALAMMGIGVIDSIASADEMNKAGASIKNVATTSSSSSHELGDTIQFGKHIGKKWEDIPLDYLMWLISNEKTKTDVREKATQAVKNKKKIQEVANDERVKTTDEKIDPDDIPF